MYYVPPLVIERDAAQAWVRAELTETDREVLTYIQKCRIVHPEQLEYAIQQGTVEAHPSWEDPIDWTNLIAYRDQMLQMQVHLGPDPSA